MSVLYGPEETARRQAESDRIAGLPPEEQARLYQEMLAQAPPYMREILSQSRDASGNPIGQSAPMPMQAPTPELRPATFPWSDSRQTPQNTLTPVAPGQEIGGGGFNPNVSGRGVDWGMPGGPPNPRGNGIGAGGVPVNGMPPQAQGQPSQPFWQNQPSRQMHTGPQQGGSVGSVWDSVSRSGGGMNSLANLSNSGYGLRSR